MAEVWDTWHDGEDASANINAAASDEGGEVEWEMAESSLGVREDVEGGKGGRRGLDLLRAVATNLPGVGYAHQVFLASTA